MFNKNHKPKKGRPVCVTSKSVLHFTVALLLCAINTASIASAPQPSEEEAPKGKTAYEKLIQSAEVKDLQPLAAKIEEHTINRIKSVVNIARGYGSEAYNTVKTSANKELKIPTQIVRTQALSKMLLKLIIG